MSCSMYICVYVVHNNCSNRKEITLSHMYIYYSLGMDSTALVCTCYHSMHVYMLHAHKDCKFAQACSIYIYVAVARSCCPVWALFSQTTPLPAKFGREAFTRCSLESHVRAGSRPICPRAPRRGLHLLVQLPVTTVHTCRLLRNVQQIQVYSNSQQSRKFV